MVLRQNERGSILKGGKIRKNNTKRERYMTCSCFGLFSPTFIGDFKLNTKFDI